MEHEFAENVSLYPALRACGEAGQEAATAGLRQQGVTEQLVLDLAERFDAQGDFGPSLAAVVEAVGAQVRGNSFTPITGRCT